MASTLPPNPSLDHLRDGARALQRGVRTADPAALATVPSTIPAATSPWPVSSLHCTMLS
ncbi:Uncharacterised protein [Mycobacteroides abscessus]|nr:Uncharacterised protein [Mycobacteroides abscessus]